MSGQALSILRRSSRAHTMNAFIGRLMCGRAESSRDALLPLPGEPRTTFALYSFPANIRSRRRRRRRFLPAFAKKRPNEEQFRSLPGQITNKVTRKPPLEVAPTT